MLQKKNKKLCHKQIFFPPPQIKKRSILTHKQNITQHNIKGINYNLQRGVSDSFALLTDRLRREKNSYEFRVTVLNQQRRLGEKKNLSIPIQIFSCVALNVKQQYSSVYWKKKPGRGEGLGGQRSEVRGRRGAATQRTNPRESRPLVCVCVCFRIVPIFLFFFPCAV